MSMMTMYSKFQVRAEILLVKLYEDVPGPVVEGQLIWPKTI